MKLVLREGRVELELADGSSNDGQEFIERLASAGETYIGVVEDEEVPLFIRRWPTPAELEEERRETEGWLRVMAAGGGFDFLDNEIDNAVWG